MLDEQNAILDDLLCKWHQWQQGARVARGFNQSAVGMEGYRTSRQYDDANGALDAHVDDVIMKAVDHEVNELDDPHRTAIYCLARALTLGVMVFRSPRLPLDAAQFDEIIALARRALVARLVRAGII